jgi:glycerophosphoryl diester phosphodiesterase
MQLFAHHGDLARWPENTIEGLAAAAETDIDGLEIDVGRSADGTWWLMHDLAVDRTTDGTGLVSELTDAELAGLTIDGGAGFVPANHAGQLRVHTLQEVLDRVGWAKTVMVDVKSTEPELYADLARFLVEHGYTDAYVICQTAGGVQAVKSVDRRLRTVFGAPLTWREGFDVYLIYAKLGVRWPQISMADFFGDTAMFVDADFTGREDGFLDQARRWGVHLSIVNDTHAALAWRDRVTR